MLKVGDAAPPFEAVGSDGKRFSLYQQASLCTVIYFFPKAFTPGCTTETKEFGKHYVELELAGAALVGISTDDRDTQCRFASSLDAPFPMLGDHDRAICRAYDVLWPLVGVAHRVTYVVAPPPPRLASAPMAPALPTLLSPGVSGHPAPAAPPVAWTVEAVFHHELRIGAHRDEVLRFVNAKFQNARPRPRPQ
jgi:peroxiredoxin Q/BCP